MQKLMDVNKTIRNSSYECQLTKFLGSCLIIIQKEEGKEANH
jgi:hypothetical protein